MSDSFFIGCRCLICIIIYLVLVLTLVFRIWPEIPIEQDSSRAQELSALNVIKYILSQAMDMKPSL